MYLRVYAVYNFVINVTKALKSESCDSLTDSKNKVTRVSHEYRCVIRPVNVEVLIMVLNIRTK